MPIYVTKPFLPPLQEFLPYLAQIWESRVLSNCGPFHDRLEYELCKALKVYRTSLFNNGTLALVTAFHALGIRDSEVITTPYSFVATSNAIILSGNTPVFVDTEPGSASIDPAKIEAAITPKTKAILPVHCYGHPCDMENIARIAQKYGLKVIYDAAHAFAVETAAGSVLTHGDLSILSFHATKTFNTFEGGAIVCHDHEMKRKIDRLKNFGLAGENELTEIGTNAKMSEFHAALGVFQLKYLEHAIALREQIDKLYRAQLQNIPGIECLENKRASKKNYNYFPILVKDTYSLTRDGLYELLKSHDIYSRRYFYPLITNFSPYSVFPSSNPSNLPVATEMATQILCLPIYPELSLETVQSICTLIKSRGAEIEKPVAQSLNPPNIQADVAAKIIKSLVQGCRYREAVELYESGRIAVADDVYEIIGFCYYQLPSYEKAIPLLEKAIRIYPGSFSPRYHLALCFKGLNKNSEAIDQLLTCLKLHFPQIDQILDPLLPLAAHNPELEAFAKINSALAGINLSALSLIKVLFYQRRDNQIPPMQGAKLCRFYSAKDLADAGCGRYLSLGEPEKLRFVYLQNNTSTWIDTLSPYVAEIPDATLMHNSSLVLVGENKILADFLSNADYGRFVDMAYDTNVLARRNDALLIKEPKPEAEIPEGIMLNGLASSEYGHWFAEFLPKLRFLEKHPRFSQLPIIIDEGMPQSHYDFLSVIASNPIRRIAKGASLKVKNLLIAPTDVFFPTELVKNHAVPPKQQSGLTTGALKYIRSKITARFSAHQNPAARIYLSRQNSRWRRLINEKEIIPILEKLGFKTVCTETLSFEEQVKVFQEAAYIVAPNGSALNNLAFSNPKVKVLMFGQKNFFNWGTWFGAFMELGYSISYLAGNAVTDENFKHADYFIPTDVIQAKVVEMLHS
jgi:dTDP-4-amino-4,6-dideoxygalactose transaminase